MFGRFKSKARKPMLSMNKAHTPGDDFPYFWALFLKYAREQGYDFNFNLKQKTDLVLVFRGASKSLPRIKARQAQGAKVIHRVDGIWGFNEQDILGHPKTKTLLDVLEIADAVIYQSRFNRDVFDALLPRPKPGCKEYVIYNGADPEVFYPDGPAEVIGEFPKLLLTSAWHLKDSKGLENVIDVFQALERDDVGLAVLGEPDRRIEHPRIRYLGRVDHARMARLFRGADAFVYLPWFDWCPNNVVEAILSGLPVVASSQGGQAELVGRSGIVVPAMPEREIAEFYKPASVDIATAVEAISTVLDNPAGYQVARPDLTIQRCLEQYLEVFRETLGWWGE